MRIYRFTLDQLMVSRVEPSTFGAGRVFYGNISISMSWRTQRQLAAMLVILVFLGIFGGVSYWRFSPEPTCFDTVKNQDELNTDCGGVCGPCELKNPKDIVILWTRAVPVGKTVFDVAAYVRNTNEILASPSLEYRFTLLDSEGVIAERIGRTYIYPQERTYIVEANIPVLRIPTRVEFAIIKSNWTVYRESPPNVVVHGKEYFLEQETASTSRSVIKAELFNDSSFDFRTVDVHFLLFDTNENLIGVNKTILERFLTRTAREARTVWPGVVAGTVSSVIVEPRVNVFTPTWLIQPQ